MVIEKIKQFARVLLNFLHLDLTKNLEYDRLTKKIMKMAIGPDSNCVDIGCHKGEMLDEMLKFSPNGKHFAFEPIPEMYADLDRKYSGKAAIYPFALADSNGVTTFNYVKNAPAYSGIRKRKYDINQPEIEEITVELRTLDGVIDKDTRIDFIKIDVEGAELGVLKGALELIRKYKPVIVFECGLGASEYYGTKPADIYSFFSNAAGLHISLLKSFIDKGKPLTAGEFEDCFNTNKEYYFIAHQ